MNKSTLFILIFSLLCSINGFANVVFQFQSGTIDSGTLKSKMENNVTALLTEINRAGTQGLSLDLSGIDMEPEAKTRLNNFWHGLHFVCDKEMNVSNCLNDFQGYQIRSIPITMKPIDDSYKQSIYRELTISLNKYGVITGVRPAMENQEDATKIMKEAKGVEDARLRRELLKWIEDFRCYYNEKNLKALNQIYSDDALIITGSVVSQRKMQRDGGFKFQKKVKYTVQSKKQYIDKLARIFKANDLVNVEFDHISVVRHGAKPDIYGVTLHQKWLTQSAVSKYEDVGWLFMIWDFSDPERPQILIRTWQENQAVNKDGIFTLDDFKMS